uniref:Uncharacterized protein n=1 Tax=Setaria italica TaxID=4555 RepID=K3YKE4_SETIT
MPLMARTGADPCFFDRLANLWSVRLSTANWLRGLREDEGEGCSRMRRVGGGGGRLDAAGGDVRPVTRRDVFAGVWRTGARAQPPATLVLDDMRICTRRPEAS